MYSARSCTHPAKSAAVMRLGVRSTRALGSRMRTGASSCGHAVVRPVDRDRVRHDAGLRHFVLPVLHDERATGAHEVQQPPVRRDQLRKRLVRARSDHDRGIRTEIGSRYLTRRDLRHAQRRAARASERRCRSPRRHTRRAGATTSERPRRTRRRRRAIDPLRPNVIVIDELVAR